MAYGILSAIAHTAGAALGGWLGGPLGLLVGAALGLLPGMIFGRAIASTRVYRPDVKGFLLFVVDHTWSLPNTVVGAIYLGPHLAAGHSLDEATSRHSCRLN
ncbi:hypothetical protein [Micromonospora sp. U21]|uniref:hypothetical protein n=1 Tax=Micromonospora sp. U21 TaxID=2824899 RepID=UPI001B38F69E|nr:hypothetical protein [Micromonospora sp. U21]MBQ0906357.1 hypothetical protein [Micromonospora sp. U21]